MAAPDEIEVEDLRKMHLRGEPVTILDVREPWEADICAIDGSVLIPLASLPERVTEVPEGGPVVVLCHHGVRSAHAANWLRDAGRTQVSNLAGGIDAWARRVDTNMERY